MTSDLPAFWGGEGLTENEVRLVKDYMRLFRYDRGAVIATYKTGDELMIHIATRDYPFRGTHWTGKKKSDGTYPKFVC